MRRILLAAALLAFSAAQAWASDPQAVGATCATNGVTAGPNQSGETVICASGAWALTPLYNTNTAASCTSTNAGEIKYVSNVLYFCNGTAWTAINGNAAPAAGCGTSATLSSSEITTLSLTAGCTVQFKVWGAGGGQPQPYNGYAGGNGGGGGYATITLGPLGSATTYYLSVGGGGGGGDESYCGTGDYDGGGGLTGYTGGGGGAGPGYACDGTGGGSASGVWTGSYGGTAVVVAAGGGGGGGASYYGAGNAGYGGGTGGTQNGGTTGGTGGTGATAGGSGGGGGGYTTGGAGGPVRSGGWLGGYGGYGGTNYAASGGSTTAGSGSTPGNSGDANLPANAGYGATSVANGYDGAIYYTTH